MRENELINGEIYEMGWNHDNDTKRVVFEHGARMGKDCYYVTTDGTFSWYAGWHYNNPRIATPGEKAHLRACIEAGRYVPDTYSKPNYPIYL